MAGAFAFEFASGGVVSLGGGSPPRGHKAFLPATGMYLLHAVTARPARWHFFSCVTYVSLPRSCCENPGCGWSKSAEIWKPSLSLLSPYCGGGYSHLPLRLAFAATSPGQRELHSTGCTRCNDWKARGVDMGWTGMADGNGASECMRVWLQACDCGVGAGVWRVFAL